MKTSATLATQALDKRKAAKALSDKGTLSAEESKQVDTLMDEAEDLEKQSSAAKRREERAEANDRAIREAALPAPRRTAADDDGDGGAVAKPAWLKDPKRGYPSLRAFLLDHARARVTRRASAQLASLRPTGALIEGLEIQAAAGSDESSTFYDPSMGSMVPVGLLPGLLSIPAPTDPFPNTIREGINVPVVEINARVDKDHSTSVTGGFRMHRRGESGTVDSSRSKREKVALRADSLMGTTFETEELLRYAPGLLAGMIQAGFTAESMNTRIKEIVGGDGVGRNVGWRNGGCVVTVPKETGQKTNTIVYENLIQMLARSYGGKRWVANPTTMPSLAKMNAGTNGLVWQPNAREGLPGILLGLPLVFTEYLPTVGNPGDIALVNDAEYIEVVSQGLEGAESIHVRFLENERAFRFTEARGGAPWWRSALQPVNGDTLSPWVELAARLAA